MRAQHLPLLAAVLAACATVRPPGEPGPFRDARAVAFDPAGRAYVVDGDLGLCRESGAGWTCVVGAEDVRLVDPVALDAGDGLMVLVADRAGRILRLDREGVVRDALTVPSQASRAGEAPRFAPVAVVRDALGGTLALDPLLGVVRWDAARQFSVVVPPERLPRGAQALLRTEDGFAVLGAGVVARFDSFGTETGRRVAPAAALGLVAEGTRYYAVLPDGLVPIGTGAPAAAWGSETLVGAGRRGGRWCWLTRTDLFCEPSAP